MLKSYLFQHMEQWRSGVFCYSDITGIGTGEKDDEDCRLCDHCTVLEEDLMGLNIDAGRFARGFVLRKATRRISGIIEHIGPEGIYWLIEHNEPISCLLCFAEYEKPVENLYSTLDVNIENIKRISLIFKKPHW